MNNQRTTIHNIAELPAIRNDTFVATLLVPELLRDELLRLLHSRGYTLSRFLRFLLRKYRARLLQNDIPVNIIFRTSYQAPGLHLKRFNFRPDPESWETFGFFAMFIGISRCQLFTWLLWAEITGGYPDEGVPTDRLRHYDIQKPDYFEFRRRLYPGRYIRRRREIHSIPAPPEQTPHWLFPYPENLEWLRLKILEDTRKRESGNG